MKGLFSFNERPVLFILKNIPSILPGIEKVLTVFYSAETEKLHCYILKNDDEKHIVEEGDIDPSLPTFQKLRSSSSPFFWLRDEDIPFEIVQRELPSLKTLADIKNLKFFLPVGCVRCNNTGYKGRLSIAEVMIMNEDLKSMVSQRAPFQKIRDVARANGMQTLYESALKKVEEGSTSLEDALSITLGAD